MSSKKNKKKSPKYLVNPRRKDSIRDIKEFENLELIKLLAIAMLIPDNQSSLYRIEQIITDLLTQPPSFGKRKDVLKAVKDINKLYPPLVEEDPPTEPFSRIIYFAGKNYTVFTGISNKAVCQLQNLIKALNMNYSSLDKCFIAEIQADILFFLTISNMIAKRLDINRYTISNYQWKETIRFPETDNEYSKLKNALTFSFYDLHNVVPRPKGFKDIIINYKSINYQDSIENEWLVDKPILLQDEGIFVLNPASLVNTLLNRIQSQVAKSTSSNAITCTIGTILFEDGVRLLMSMSYSPIGETYTVSYGAFSIQSLHFALMDDTFIFSVITPSSLFDKNEDLDSVVQKIEKSGGNNALHIISINGNPFFLGRKMRSFFIDNEDLQVVRYYNDKIPNLLWKLYKFVEKRDSLIFAFSFIDTLGYYINTIDEKKYVKGDIDCILTDSSYGHKILETYLCFNDKHVIATPGNEIVHITKKQYYDVGVYDVETSNIGKYVFLVNLYCFYLWVGIGSTVMESIEIELDVCEAITFWLSKLSDRLRSLPTRNNINHVCFNVTMDSTISPKSITVMIKVYCNRQSMRSTIFTLPFPGDIFNSSFEKDLINHVLNNFLSGIAQNDDSNSGLISTLLDKHSIGQSNRIIFSIMGSVKLTPIPQGWRLSLHESDLYEIEYDWHSLSQKDEGFAINIFLSKYKQYCIDRIKVLLQDIDINELIIRLLEILETSIYDKEVYHIRMPFIVKCFPNSLIEIQEKIKIIEHTQQSSRFLIELSMHEKGGNIHPSTNLITSLLSYSFLYLVNGNHLEAYNSDLWSYRIEGSDFELTTISPNLSEFSQYVLAKQEETLSRIIKQKRLNLLETDEVSNDSSTFTFVKNNIDKAFMDEYHFSFEEYLFITETFIKEAMNYEGVRSISINDMIGIIHRYEPQIPEENIENCLNWLTIVNRDKWESVPKGYNKREIEPWYYLRTLSLKRKPIIAIGNILFFGAKWIELSREMFQIELFNGQFAPDKAVSNRMKTLLDKIRTNNSKDFVERVYQRILERKKEWIIERNVEINTSGKIRIVSDLALGDIDLFAFDTLNNICFSIECKRINAARCSLEIRNEISKLFYDQRNASSWLSKHFNRHNWLINNKKNISDAFTISNVEFEIVSVIITSEVVPTRYLRSCQLGIYTLDEFEEIYLSSNTNY